jgi:hypothetical protein
MAVRDAGCLQRQAGLGVLLADVDLHQQHVVALGEPGRSHAGQLPQLELEVVDHRHRRASFAS